MMFAKWAVTRRGWGRMLAAAALGGWWRGARAADPRDTGPLTWGAEPASNAGHERRYRAHAQILLLGLPLVRWPNVGGGSAAWRESPAANRGRLRFLEFAGFSSPERAAGLNRLGFIQELSRVGADGALEAIYFGLMTASPEETAEEARKALHSTAKAATYTAIDGRLAQGTVETVIAHFMAPARWSMGNRTELMERARMAVAAAKPRPPEGDTRGAAMRPFLHALAGALAEPGPVDAAFSYAGRRYRLGLDKSEDAKATASYRKGGLIPSNGSVLRVAGKLRREAGGKETEFRLWVENGSAHPLPLRIEYQAKAYLRLVFEADS